MGNGGGRDFVCGPVATGETDIGSNRSGGVRFGDEVA